MSMFEKVNISRYDSESNYWFVNVCKKGHDFEEDSYVAYINGTTADVIYTDLTAARDDLVYEAVQEKRRQIFEENAKKPVPSNFIVFDEKMQDVTKKAVWFIGVDGNLYFESGNMDTPLQLADPKYKVMFNLTPRA